MVAMATSLSDRAWGKDSAVYRVTGVFTVIAGWFLTAFTAFIIAAVFASILQLTGMVGTVILLALAIFSVVRTQVIFRRREKTRIKAEEIDFDGAKATEQNVIERCTEQTVAVLDLVPGILESIYVSLAANSLRELRKSNITIKELNDAIKQEKVTFPQKIEKFPESYLETSSFYIQVLDYMKEVGNCLTFIVKPSLEHVDNNHQEILEVQKEELDQLSAAVKNYFGEITLQLKKAGTNDNEKIRTAEQAIVDQVARFKKRQIKRIKAGESKTRNSMLYLNILEETKKLVIYTHSLIKALDEMIRYKH